MDRHDTTAQAGHILEALPGAVLVMDQHGTIVQINAQTERLFGYQRQELYGHPVALLGPDFALSDLQLGAATRTLTGVRKDGSAFSAELALHTLVTPEGPLVVGLIREVTPPPQTAADCQPVQADVDHALRTSTLPGAMPHQQLEAAMSARRQAEEALHASEQRWLFALEGNGDGVWDWDIVTNKVFFSPRWKAMLGYDVDEIGEHVDEWTSRVHPADLDVTLVALQRHLRGDSREYASEHRLRCKDGSYKWILDRGKVLARSADGSPLRMVGTHTDITDWKEATQERDLLFALSLDLLCIAGLDGYFKRVNPAFEKTLGYTSAELLAIPFLHLVHPDDQESTAQALAKLARGLDCDYFENRYRCKDGSWRWLAWSCPAPPPDSTTLYAMARDITAHKTTIQQLQASEARFRSLIALSSDWYWEQDADFRFTALSATAPVRSGLSLAEHLGKTPWELLTSGVTQEAWDAYHTLLARHAPFYDFEFQRLDANGESIYISMSGHPIFDESGVFQGYRGISKNITTRKRAEAALQAFSAALEQRVSERTEQLAAANDALRQSEQRLRQVIDLVPHYIFAKDVSGRFILVNQAVAQTYGVTVEELTGKTDADFAQSPEEVEHFRADDLAVIESGAPRIIPEEQITDAQGQVHILSTIKIPFTCSGTTLPAVLGVAVDITAAKEQERQLRESRRFIQQLANTMPGMLYLHDIVAQQNVYLNARVEAILGYTVHDIQAMGNSLLQELMHPDDHERQLAHLQKLAAAQDGAIVEFTYRIRHRRGTWVWLLSRDLVFTRCADGTPQRILGVAHDVTARIQAEEALRTLNAELEQRVQDRTAQLAVSNRELEAFCYSVSHDLRAPLRAVDGFAQALMDEYGHVLASEGQRYLARMRAASQRMGVLIDALLNLSRLARHRLRQMPVSLSALAADIAADLQATQPQRHVTWDIAPDLTVYADTDLMRIVLENLLQNAWKYTSKHAHAHITFGRLVDAGRDVYFVRDDGAGFDMAYIDKLFGAFQRLHRESEFAGTGIGLATVERVIHRHGGRVWAEGAVEQGATFYFTLSGKEAQV